MEKKHDFEDSPKGLQDPIQCDCGKWMEKAHAHEMGVKLICRGCKEELDAMLKRSKGVKVPK